MLVGHVVQEHGFAEVLHAVGAGVADGGGVGVEVLSVVGRSSGGRLGRGVLATRREEGQQNGIERFAAHLLDGSVGLASGGGVLPPRSMPRIWSSNVPGETAFGTSLVPRSSSLDIEVRAEGRSATCGVRKMSSSVLVLLLMVRLKSIPR